MSNSQLNRPSLPQKQATVLMPVLLVGLNAGRGVWWFSSIRHGRAAVDQCGG